MKRQPTKYFYISIYTTLTITVSALIVFLIFNIVLVSSMYELIKDDVYKLTGALALAAACGSIVNAVLNAIMLFNKRKGMLKKEDIITILKVIVSSAVMSVIVKLLYDFVRVYSESMVGDIFVCAVCGVCGIVVYVTMLILLRVKEFTAIISRKNK